MRIYKKEFNRLKSAKSFVKSFFPGFGINKKQEITRLLYEISKRDNLAPKFIINKTDSLNYDFVKKSLLSQRYPVASLGGRIKPYLPKLELKAAECLVLKKRIYSPKNIFVEKNAEKSFLAGRVRNLFPSARFNRIESLKAYQSKHRRFKIEDYNHRQDNLFIVNENHDFFKQCPCTINASGCGYHVFNLGFGCIFECAYCYLQGYANAPGIILPANIDRFFDRFKAYQRAGMRIGSGEFSDSLALDEVADYAGPIIEFFSKRKGVVFEFKTKSINIGNLLRAKHSGNIVVSWSLNPQKIIDENEFFTANLKERLSAAASCVKAGYQVGFHFDPVIYSDTWESEYRRLIDDLFAAIRPESIAWISLGTFRFSPGIKQVIEKRFPANKILNEELLLGFDQKLRYPYGLRLEIYQKMQEMLFTHSRRIKVYLCMEEAGLIKACSKSS